MNPWIPGTTKAHLRLPKVDTEGDAPCLKPSPADRGRIDFIAKRMTGTRMRQMAPNLWIHLLDHCKSNVSRSDGQRGRWSEYRVRLVRDKISKAAKARLSPPALATALLEVTQANYVRDPKLEAICGLLALRGDKTWKTK